MNVIERAQRRYRELVPDDLVGAKPAERARRLPASRIEAWIANYVVPAVEEVWERPTFQEHATWPQRSLVAGVDTEERTAVQRVDTALIAEAKALRRLMRNKLIARQLDSMHCDGVANRDEVASTAAVDEEEWVNGLPTKHELIPFYRSQIDQFANGAWTDLVCGEDYFGPAGGMMRKAPLPEGTTEASMVVLLSPNLFYVGDLITRFMLKRVRSWTSFLAEARDVCHEVMQRLNRSYEKQMETERAAWHELQESTNDLQRLCLVGIESRIRESCITLAQVYAEFHTNPDLSGLAVPEHALHRFRGQLRRNLTSEHDLETLDRIATAVEDLKLLYRELDADVSVHDETIASGGLVLIEATQKAYWQGHELQIEWNRHGKPWELLWKLATNAKSASAVGDYDLYLEGASRSTIYNRWSRLKELIPASLHSYVIPGGERATYRLNLPIKQIHLFSAAR